MSETIARYPDPDDKLSIALGNFNRLRLEREAFKDALELERSLNESVVAERQVFARILHDVLLAAPPDVQKAGLERIARETENSA